MFLGEKELGDLIRSTKDLIDNEPNSIVMKRDTWTRTTAGGQIHSGFATQTAITCWLSGIIEDARVVERDEGEQIVCRHVLIGMPEEDIQEKDVFFVDNRKFEVIEIHPARQFQIKAWCVERASDGNT